jgi:hypothetical protein
VAKGPSCKKLDLDQAESVVLQNRPHFGDIYPSGDRAGQVVEMQPNPGESGRGGCFTTLNERVPRRLGKTRTRQSEEARDQTRKLRGPTRVLPGDGVTHHYPCAYNPDFRP